ncbi:unnamed protein product [Meganyctiphanes norvegica]|uniref:Secreted protein n=1 Tax=Meganyctiphanes norvegica TaxID=48144 RepID=A0AAV2RNU6_MEGNR
MLPKLFFLIFATTIMYIVWAERSHNIAEDTIAFYLATKIYISNFLKIYYQRNQFYCVGKRSPNYIENHIGSTGVEWLRLHGLKWIIFLKKSFDRVNVHRF